MNLLPNWKTIVRKARSMRAMGLAAVFSGAEMVLPIYFTDLPRGTFVALALVSIFGGMYFRITAQKEFEDGK